MGSTVALDCSSIEGDDLRCREVINGCEPHARGGHSPRDVKADVRALTPPQTTARALAAPDDARARLSAQVHGVLCTLHPERGPDPRASLLVEHWELADRLTAAVPQYADKPFHRISMCRILAVTGWAASDAALSAG